MQFSRKKYVKLQLSGIGSSSTPGKNWQVLINELQQRNESWQHQSNRKKPKASFITWWVVVLLVSRYRHARTKGGEDRAYSFYSFLISALDGVSGQHHAPAALYPRERTPVHIVLEARWASGLVWTQRLEEKFPASAGDVLLKICFSIYENNLHCVAFMWIVFILYYRIFYTVCSDRPIYVLWAINSFYCLLVVWQYLGRDGATQ
jgi:hypothetical protein